MAFFERTSVEFHSLLSTEECIKKLLATIDKSYWYGPHSVIGTIQQNKFNLRRRHSYHYISTLPVFIFHGTLREDAVGTVVEGHFGMNLVMKIFLDIWIFVFAPFAYANGAPVFSFLFLLSGVGVFGSGQFLGKRDKEYLLEFNRKNVERASSHYK